MNLDEIKTLLKSGDVADAEAAAQELLAAEPDNVQALMLYGTCRQLQGDEATFRRINDELAPRMAAVVDAEAQGLWQKYAGFNAKFCNGALVMPRLEFEYARAGLAVMEWLVIGGLVLAALVFGGLYFGRDILSCFAVMEIKTTHATSLYGGPGYEDPRREGPQDVDPAFAGCQKFDHVENRIEYQAVLRDGQICPRCKGTGLSSEKSICNVCGGYGKGRRRENDKAVEREDDKAVEKKFSNECSLYAGPSFSGTTKVGNERSVR